MGTYNADPNPDTDRIRQVAFAFAFAPTLDLRVDQFSTLTSNKVYNLTRLIGKTRLRILVDPNLLPS